MQQQVQDAPPDLRRISTYWLHHTLVFAMLCVLLDRFPELLTFLLQQWLMLKEVVLLDSALCNRSLRQTFFAALSYGNLCDRITMSPSKCGYFDWMICREIAITAVSLRDEDPESYKYPRRIDPKTIFTAIMKWFTSNEIGMDKWICAALLQCVSDLKKLSIITEEDETPFTPVVLQTIATCTQLRALRLTHHFFVLKTRSQSYALTPVMQQCHLLEEVKICGFVFTEQDATQISKRLMVFAYMSRDDLVPLAAEPLKILVERCTSLQSLCIYNYAYSYPDPPPPLFNAPMYQLIARSLPHLQELAAMANFMSCDGVEVLLGCEQLQRLSLGDCSTLTADTFAALVQHTQFVSLVLRNNMQLTGTLRFPFLNRTLQHLALHDFAALTDEGLTSILAGCPALLTLTITHERILLTPNIVDAIVQYCPRMQLVQLTPRTKQFVTEVRAKLQKLGSAIKVSFVAPVGADDFGLDQFGLQ